MRNVLSLSALLVFLTLTGPVTAQSPSSVPAAPPFHHGIPGHLFHRPGQTAALGTGMTPVSGTIVGNKKSHIYHLPGDKGSLPSAQNRVYFRSETEAAAAGYHKTGTGSGKTHPIMGGNTPNGRRL